MTIQSLIETFNLRFTSGNSTPVERTHITKEEFDLLMKYVKLPVICDIPECTVCGMPKSNCCE